LGSSVADDTNPLQESMERTAQIGELFLPSPPRFLSAILALLATTAAAALLGADLEALVDAVGLVLAPALLAAVLTPPAARLAGSRYYPQRAAIVAALGALVVAIGVLATVPLGLLGLAAADVILTSVGLVWVGGFLADHRHPVAVSLSAIQPLATVPGLARLFDGPTLVKGLVVWFALLAPFVLVLRLFDAPLTRNFGISGADLFRSYLDHVTADSAEAERLLERVGQPVQAPIGVVAFQREDGSRKACMVVPTVHPGPFGALGGGDLPAKMRDALRDWEHVLVPHGAADHDLNPVTTEEVERLGRYVRELAEDVDPAPGGSTFVEAGDTVRVGAQLFGPDAFLTYTSWPQAIDDVDQGVGHHAELHAEAAGARQAVFADCHNSLQPSAGAVFPLTERALAIEDRAHEATETAVGDRVDRIRVGVAQDRTLGMRHLIGRAGCQVLVVEAGEQRTAYVLWDGNNMEPDATDAIGQAVGEVVDAVRVMTTDNHAVNVEGGTYSPVGLRVSHDALARISKETARRAIADLEPVEAGVATGHAPGLEVVGHQRTAQLSASINTMVSVLPELVAALAALWVLGLATVFLVW
jgi:putative membrane protein